MSFSEQWLSLREPYDVAARNRDVLKAAADAFAGQSSLSVVDLACGTGSTFRSIASHFPVRQSWRLVDNDLSLLARARPPSSPPDILITTKPIDLVRDLELALDGHVDLVTTSAFLDLVSGVWLERLLVELAARHLPFYAVLSYDGRVVFDPVDPRDAAIVAAVNRHQLTDKGFGPALGPASAEAATAGMRRLGYTIVQGQSDWVFTARDVEIQTEVISGWANAARETKDLSLSEIADWLGRRRAAIAAGRSSIRVGHVDFFARPMTTR